VYRTCLYCELTTLARRPSAFIADALPQYGAEPPPLPPGVGVTTGAGAGAPPALPLTGSAVWVEASILVGLSGESVTSPNVFRMLRSTLSLRVISLRLSSWTFSPECLVFVHELSNPPPQDRFPCLSRGGHPSCSSLHPNWYAVFVRFSLINLTLSNALLKPTTPSPTGFTLSLNSFSRSMIFQSNRTALVAQLLLVSLAACPLLKSITMDFGRRQGFRESKSACTFGGSFHKMTGARNCFRIDCGHICYSGGTHQSEHRSRAQPQGLYTLPGLA